MLTHQTLSAWISVDGQELPQYKTTVQEEVASLPHHPWTQTTYKISCWISSEEGKACATGRTSVAEPPGLIVSKYRNFMFMLLLKRNRLLSTARVCTRMAAPRLGRLWAVVSLLSASFPDALREI